MQRRLNRRPEFSYVALEAFNLGTRLGDIRPQQLQLFAFLGRGSDLVR
jgi:hypothetical protein